MCSSGCVRLALSAERRARRGEVLTCIPNSCIDIIVTFQNVLNALAFFFFFFLLLSTPLQTRMKIRDTHKVVVMGAGSVGKTSLIVQFMEGFFSSTYKPTVEDYYRHTIQLPGKPFDTTAQYLTALQYLHETRLH